MFMTVHITIHYAGTGKFLIRNAESKNKRINDTRKLYEWNRIAYLKYKLLHKCRIPQ
jgi:hypothetical protein